MALREISIALALAWSFFAPILVIPIYFKSLNFILDDYFENWSTTESCNYTSNWTSCNAGTGVIYRVSGNYAYSRTLFRVSGGSDGNILTSGHVSESGDVWISLSGRHLNPGPGEYRRTRFGSNWASICDSGNGTDTQYKQTHIDVSNRTCARVYLDFNEKEDLRAKENVGG